MTVVSYLNRQGGLHSHSLYGVARSVLIWDQTKFLSIRAVRLPGHLNSGADTIINYKAPSTRRLFAFKWKIFASWCRQRVLDPVHCPIGSVLEFLQSHFSEGVTPATLKV